MNQFELKEYIATMYDEPPQVAALYTLNAVVMQKCLPDPVGINFCGQVCLRDKKFWCTDGRILGYVEYHPLTLLEGLQKIGTRNSELNIPWTVFKDAIKSVGNLKGNPDDQVMVFLWWPKQKVLAYFGTKDPSKLITLPNFEMEDKWPSVDNCAKLLNQNDGDEVLQTDTIVALGIPYYSLFDAAKKAAAYVAWQFTDATSPAKFKIGFHFHGSSKRGYMEPMRGMIMPVRVSEEDIKDKWFDLKDPASMTRKDRMVEKLKRLLNFEADVKDGQCGWCGQYYPEPDGFVEDITCTNDQCPAVAARALLYAKPEEEKETTESETPVVESTSENSGKENPFG